MKVKPSRGCRDHVAVNIKHSGIVALGFPNVRASTGNIYGGGNVNFAASILSPLQPYSMII
jgi:hypothetical protein